MERLLPSRGGKIAADLNADLLVVTERSHEVALRICISPRFLPRRKVTAGE